MTIKQQIKNIMIDYFNGVIGILLFSPLVVVSISILTIIAKICWIVVSKIWDVF